MFTSLYSPSTRSQNIQYINYLITTQQLESPHSYLEYPPVEVCMFFRNIYRWRI